MGNRLAIQGLEFAPEPVKAPLSARGREALTEPGPNSFGFLRLPRRWPSLASAQESFASALIPRELAQTSHRPARKSVTYVLGIKCYLCPGQHRADSPPPVPKRE